MTTTARAVAILVCLLTLSGVHAAAQDPTGTIEGTVTDPPRLQSAARM
jgi:hypothetical protein